MYIRVARHTKGEQGEERFIILVAPDELHATITLTGTRVHGPFDEARTRAHLEQLQLSPSDVDALLAKARAS
jgi:hypothetical protein